MYSEARLEGPLVRRDHRLEEAFHLAVEVGGQLLAVAAGDRLGTEADDDVEAPQLEQPLRVGEEGRVALPADRQMRRRLPGRGAAGERRRVDRQAATRRMVEQRGAKAAHVEEREGRPQDGEEDAGDQRQRHDAHVAAQEPREPRRRGRGQSVPQGMSEGLPVMSFQPDRRPPVPACWQSEVVRESAGRKRAGTIVE